MQTQTDREVYIERKRRGEKRGRDRKKKTKQEQRSS
jgi:hypothetical protein